MFSEAAKDWDLERLYRDIENVRQPLRKRRFKLGEPDKEYLRGLLLGNSPAEIAVQVSKSAGTVQDSLSKGLYRYVETLTNRQANAIEHWSQVADWLSQAGYKKTQPPQQLPAPLMELSAPQRLDIDTLVQKVRQHCYRKIQQLYGKMHLLDISQPVDVDRLYVEVNILEQIASQQWLEISDLLQGFNPDADNFERLGLGRVRQKRVPGLEAVQRYNRLMVLGKPGSGKTTFLQHIAIECNQGRFQADRVPIFIRLKNLAKYADKNKNFSLVKYISQEFRSCDIWEREVNEQLLHYGKQLILLDGLDELSHENESKVVEQIQQFSERYYQNQFVISSRIANSQYRFALENFRSVEIADFKDRQIQTFAKKWFVAVAKNDRNDGTVKATQFIDKLNRPENQQIRELAVTPILLNLTCLVFQSKADFPSNRAKLYEQGLEILLVRWDEAKGIQRDEIYRDLTLPRKKQLLSQLAAITFERGDYFFEKAKVQQLIADYLRTLPNASTDLAERQMGSEVILKAIEVQHGLLVERARAIYSFSHLTFQEYFTARKVVADFKKIGLPSLQIFVNHITEKRWRFVFLLVAEMWQEVDNLLQLMKQKIDRSIATNEKLQKFLMWVMEKSISVEVDDKPLVVRAFYFNLALALDMDFYRDTEFAIKKVLRFSLDPVINPVCLDYELRKGLQEFKARIPDIDGDWELVKQWVKTKSIAGVEKLRLAMNKYRDLDRNWQFSDREQQLLGDYYDANKLLVECLNSAACVTEEVRDKIESTLLLPFAEIDKR